VGAGHDEPAQTLAAQIRAEDPAAEVVTRDALAAIGGVVKTMSADAPAIVFYRFQVMWDIGFWLFAECPPTRRATQALLTRNSAPSLLRLIAEVEPDVIVCTYPNMTEVLGRLRRSGRLQSALFRVAGADAGDKHLAHQADLATADWLRPYSGCLYTCFNRIQDEMPEPPFVVCMLHHRQRQWWNLEAPERVRVALEHVQNHRPNNRWIGNHQDSTRAGRLHPHPPRHTHYQRPERLTVNGSCVWICSPGSETLRIVFGDRRD